MLQGFDKLVNSGMTLEDIEIMRLQFHGSRRFLNDEERYRSEENWLSGNINTGT